MRGGDIFKNPQKNWKQTREIFVGNRMNKQSYVQEVQLGKT